MNPTIAIMLAQGLNLVAVGTLALWYAVPWLKTRSRVRALTSLMPVESHIRIPDAPPTPRTAEGQRDVFKPTTFVFFVIRRFPHSQRSSRIGTMLLPSFVSE